MPPKPFQAGRFDRLAPRDASDLGEHFRSGRAADPFELAPLHEQRRLTSAQFLRSLLDEQADLLLEGVRAWMWVPVAIKNRVIGSVGVAHVEPAYFTAQHADLALTVANQAAITLINAELYEHAQALAALQERQRLAQNLHDAVNQSLFSAGLIADILPRLWERDQEEARKSLIDLRRLTRAAQAEMRALRAELRPSALTDTDLGDLMHQLGNALSGRINIPVAVSVAREVVLPLAPLSNSRIQHQRAVVAISRNESPARPRRGSGTAVRPAV